MNSEEFCVSIVQTKMYEWPKKLHLNAVLTQNSGKSQQTQWNKLRRWFETALISTVSRFIMEFDIIYMFVGTTKPMGLNENKLAN